MSQRSARTAPAESFAGYGVLGIAFDSGDVLAFRCIARSSVGPPYNALWHRSPDGLWSVWTNVEPDRACPRYFAPALHAWYVDDITVAWRSRAEVSITARRARLALALRLAASPLSWAVGACGGVAPARLLRTPIAATLAGRVLRAGPLRLHGTAPTGHDFVIRPRALRFIAAAAAVIRGHDAGPVVSLTDRIEVGGLVVPRRGLFGAGTLSFRQVVAA